MTHPLQWLKNEMTHPFAKAENLLTHPPFPPAHPSPLLFDHSLIKQFVRAFSLGGTQDSSIAFSDTYASSMLSGLSECTVTL